LQKQRRGPKGGRDVPRKTAIKGGAYGKVVIDLYREKKKKNGEKKWSTEG